MVRKLRQSQTVVPFGVGSIFDFQGESFVACDISYWGHSGHPVISNRLASVLGVGALRSAPIISQTFQSASSPGVPFHRFPTWLFCPKCRRMQRWSRSKESLGEFPECPHCKVKRRLSPMGWIQVCAAGHLDDVDWNRWAHSRPSDNDQRQCARDSLVFESIAGRGAGGLQKLQVRCLICGANRSLSGLTSKGSLKTIGGSCTGRQPWQSWQTRIPDCSEEPIVAQRRASNVYFPVVFSSIEIPVGGESKETDDAREVKAHQLFKTCVELPVNDDAPMIGFLAEQIALELDRSVDAVRYLILEERRTARGVEQAGEDKDADLLGEEWKVFVTTDLLTEDRDFQARKVELASTDGDEGITRTLKNAMETLVLVDKLREVRALQGFFRVSPGKPEFLVRSALRAKVNWLPAIEVRGEGIFFSLNEKQVSSWEREPGVVRRVRELDKRIRLSFMEAYLRPKVGLELSPRFVLLHTLSHLLIRRLAFECGYGASSLRERIYSRSADHDGKGAMAGLLIYTAAGDSEGTLGGLVRQGEPVEFKNTLLEALQDGRWCSSDPLCGENSASGLSGLNLAACHSCSLVSETSCEVGNFLLDRSLVVGADGTPGYFQPLLEIALSAAGKAVLGET